MLKHSAGEMGNLDEDDLHKINHSAADRVV